MSIRSSLLTLLFSVVSTSFFAQVQQPVGTWREHLPYGETIDVAAGNTKVYCATPFSVFAFDKEDQSLERISKVNLLSGSDVSAINVDNSSNTLVVGYSSGEVDLVNGDVAFNLSDIAQANLFGDKRIYDITILDGKAYLSCGFGIVVIDLSRREVADTYFINGQSDLLRVNALDYDDTYWYAATDIGIYRAERDNPFLVNFEVWQLLSEVPVENTVYSEVLVFGDDILIVLEDGFEDQLWVADRSDLNFSLVPGYEIQQITDIDAVGDKMTICTFNRIAVLDSDYQELTAQQNINGNETLPRAAVQDSDGTVWVANERGGLLNFTTDGIEQSFQPDGPRAFNVRRLDAFNNNVWVASGGVDPTFTNNYDKKGVYGLVEEDWVNVANVEGENNIGSINDYMDVSVNPLDNSQVMLGSWEEGMVLVKNGVVDEIYNEVNSPLELANFGGSERIGVAGLDYDPDGNLFFSNAYSNTPLHVLTASGEFASFSFLPDVDADLFIGDVVATRQGYVWAILPRGHGIVVLNHNDTPADTGDDSFQLLTNEEGQGGLPTNDIYALEEDLDGEMWVGTLQGIAVFFTPQSIFESEEFDAQQILIEQDGNVQILLETEQVNCIEIDGANRKWVGTANSGVFLLSEDGLSQVLHFTSENSPLLSDNVLDIAINQATGEVFFATDRGVISYTSTATNFDQEIQSVKVYPNPVREDFSGPITIDGLAFESDVKITDVSGNLVFTTTSFGGRAIWDGNDRTGNRVTTGVYLVFCSDQNGDATNVAKVAIIR